jgi:TolB-like protein/Tfp pilus assembly protein PilF
VPSLRFEDHILDTDRRELRRGTALVAVEPQVFDLLAYLVQKRNRVVSKDELISGVWNGRIVSDSTLTSRINAARKAVSDSGDEQRLIRTYPRKGVRFVGDVHEPAVSRGPEPDAAPAAPPPPDAGGKPCVAVLPFVNLGGDADQEHLSDGITEDIITGLSRHRSLLVIARNSTFALKGKSDDVRRIGRDLDAGYLVQGSVRRMGQRLRITAQLVETEGGRQIWGEQYDHGVEDVLAVQDEITSTIIARLEPEVGNAEASRAGRTSPQAFRAWDYFRLGTKHFYNATAADNREAQRLFRQAVDLDPTLAEAYGFLAYSIVLSMVYFDVTPDDALLDQAIETAKRGVMLDERDAQVRFMYGRALLARGAYREALAELEVALGLNPNLAVVYCGLGDCLAYGGDVAQAIPYFERAIALSPHDPLRWAFYSYGALAHLFARAFDAAEEWARRATRVPKCHYWGFAHRVAALGFLQRAEELDAAVADLRRIEPSFTRQFARKRLFYLKNRAQVEIYLEGLRRAGIPER